MLNYIPNLIIYIYALSYIYFIGLLLRFVAWHRAMFHFSVSSGSARKSYFSQGSFPLLLSKLLHTSKSFLSIYSRSLVSLVSQDYQGYWLGNCSKQSISYCIVFLFVIKVKLWAHSLVYNWSCNNEGKQKTSKMSYLLQVASLSMLKIRRDKYLFKWAE